MKSTASLGLALFAVSSFMTMTRGNVFQRFLGQRIPLLKKREKEMGQFFTRENNRGSERWRFVFSQSIEEEEEDDDVSPSSEMEQEDDSACEIEVINTSGETLIFCWVNESGKLHHYYPINSAGSIQDRSVAHAHVEYTHVGHSFVCMRSSAAAEMKDIDANDFVFVYRPTVAGRRHVIAVKGKPPTSSLTTVPIDREVIDNTMKQYKRKSLAGFVVCYEEDVFKNPVNGLKVKKLLEGDLQEVARLLPAHICKRLQGSTKIWLNKSLSYGPKHRPIIGHGACFHPMGGRQWLKNNGLSIEKEGCIEFYTVDDYVATHSHWGKGGGLLHEFCHAFHNTLVPQAFDNQDIRSAYTLAMERGKYDRVAVHGPQGRKGPQRAYACANCMEFFAELSTAFLWKFDHKNEYNKWFPHNRSQLKAHDYETYRVMEKIWAAELPPLPSTITQLVGDAETLAKMRHQLVALKQRNSPASPSRLRSRTSTALMKSPPEK